MSTPTPECNSSEIRVDGIDRVFNRTRILVVLLIPLAMALMSISAINVAIPSIEQQIGASPEDIQWMLSGYALAYGIALVPAGRIGDVIGRGLMFVIGVVMFAVGSLLCGLAHDPVTLNIARIVQGVGAGVYSPQTNGMIVQYFKGQSRANAFAMFGLTVSASVAIGPVLTGVLIQSLGADAGWRSSFIWNFPLGLIGCALALLWFPFGTERERHAARKAARETADKTTPTKAPGVDLDPIGLILLATHVLCIMLPFVIKTPLSFLLLVVAVAAILAWVAWERNYKAKGREPMVDLALFQHKSFTQSTAISAVGFLGNTSVFAILAMFLQQGLHVSAFDTGFIGVPNAVASAIAAVVAGRWVLRRGRSIQVGALAINLLGLIICILLFQYVGDGGLSFWWLALALMLNGTGVGALNSVNQTLSQEDVPHEAGGVAGAVKQTTERITTAIGNAMLTAVAFSVLVNGTWTRAITLAYIVIAVIQLVALILAIWDRKVMGEPIPS